MLVMQCHNLKLPALIFEGRVSLASLGKNFAGSIVLIL